MNSFDYENLQKKRIAQNARRHVNASRGKCRLPSDNLTKKERDALNGDVKTYRVHQPMTYDQFKDAPDYIQRQHLTFMQTEFNATDGMIGDMWGVHHSTIMLIRRKLGVASLGLGIRTTAHPEEMEKWERWLRGEVNTEMTEAGTEQETEQETEQKQTEPSNPEIGLPTTVAMEELTISWARVHSWEELYALAKQFPFPASPAHVCVEVKGKE